MRSIACIVEGHSEVESLPLLLDRVQQRINPGQFDVSIARPPVRVARDRFLRKDSEFRRFLLLAAAKVDEDDGVLVLLDADDDCPAELGTQIRNKAAQIVPSRRVSVVLAKHEFEAWLIAGARSLERIDLLDADATLPDAESVRGAKEWLDKRMSSGYSTRIDQARLSAKVDLDQVEPASRSFRKLCSNWRYLTAPRAE